MAEALAETPSFLRLGPETPQTPIVVSVPHAGRLYPERMLSLSRVPRHVLEQLADRDADRLIGGAVAAGASAIVATRARAWLDLNRDPRELDPATISPRPCADHVIETARVRGGLGLIPRRIAGYGEIARAPLPAHEIAQRIEQDHRPYHQAVAERLGQAQARFGTAILLDIHTMPSLAPVQARVVVGDRHGRSAGRTEREMVLTAARRRWPASRNIPYAGGYTLDRHGRPGRHIHAIQIEFDRSLYLCPDDSFDEVSAQLIVQWLGALVQELSMARPHSIAAE